MDNTENNKLIADFMGVSIENNNVIVDFDKHPVNFHNTLCCFDGIANTPLYELEERKFCFHYSWDWLMPVVEKIEEITQRMFDCRKHKQYYSVRISIQKNIFADKSFMGFSINKKDAYYEAVVEFIKWYNENKK